MGWDAVKPNQPTNWNHLSLFEIVAQVFVFNIVN